MKRIKALLKIPVLALSTRIAYAVRSTLTASIACIALLFGTPFVSAGVPDSLLRNIRMVTISSEDPEKAAQRYIDNIGYTRVESGTVPAPLALRWDAPAMAGRPYVILQSPDGEQSFLRFVSARTPVDYRALTTSGWNAAEFLVQNPYTVHEGLNDPAFTHIGGPAPLGVAASIHAVQYRGPDQEVLYFTADLGDNPISTLARTTHFVGRSFIVVLAGASIEELSAFYQSIFAVPEVYRTRTPIALIAKAQDLPSSHTYDLALLRLADFSHSIELDGYPSAPRRTSLQGELPPGISAVSFCVEAFSDALRANLRETPVKIQSLAYSDGRVAVMKGPAGELIELVECSGAHSD